MIQPIALDILKLGHTTFLTGAAGSGKSYVLREYITYLRRHGVRYAVTAPTGIASTHIGGTTIHAWSGIGIRQKLHTYDLDVLEEKQNLYKRWNETKVLIIDEVSMLHANFVDMLDRLAKHMRRSDRPFGGMQVVFTGDFFQLPPVIKGEGYSENIFAYSSVAWRQTKPVVCYLTEQYRQDDGHLFHLLNAIRSGEVDDGNYELLKERTEAHTNDHVKLYTHNENVNAINKEAFSKIKGEKKVYTMTTKGKAALVESLKNSCLADEVLELKVGAKVICIKNSPERKYVNGSMGKVIDFDNEGAPIVELADGRKIAITADFWRIEEDGKVRAEISQLPLKLAWAITVHKSQGMTIDRAEIDLSRAFLPGQGYVALSRLKSLEGLYLKGFNPMALQVSEHVTQVDREFVLRSTQAETAILKYNKKELEKMQQDFLLSSNGTIEEIDKEVEEIEVKIASHIITQEMLSKGQTVKEIAKERKLSEDTIIGHIEKLVEAHQEVALKHVLPRKKDREIISKAFKKLDTNKLTPVFEYLGGKYNYHQLRLVRASLK